jgi:hypothetical protein
MGADATAVLDPSETVASDTARTMPERTVSPTESEIAAVAYRLWVNNGCPAGSDREDWYRAEAMLKEALVGKCEGPSSGASIPRDTRAGFEMLAEFRYEGHWEVWEREWGGARWIWDEAAPGLAVLSQSQ